MFRYFCTSTSRQECWSKSKFSSHPSDLVWWYLIMTDAKTRRSEISTTFKKQQFGSSCLCRIEKWSTIGYLLVPNCLFLAQGAARSRHCISDCLPESQHLHPQSRRCGRWWESCASATASSASCWTPKQRARHASSAASPGCPARPAKWAPRDPLERTGM